MRVLVCGGRDFRDVVLLTRTLRDQHLAVVIETIIEGDAPGADRLAGRWARNSRIKNLKFPADWKAYGKAAGPIRNQRMLDEGKPDLVIAFPGDRGTADMVKRAREAGIEIMEVESVE